MNLTKLKDNQNWSEMSNKENDQACVIKRTESEVK